MNTREELIEMIAMALLSAHDYSSSPDTVRAYARICHAAIESAGCVVVPTNLEGHAIIGAAFYCNDGWDAICAASPFAPETKP